MNGKDYVKMMNSPLIIGGVHYIYYDAAQQVMIPELNVSNGYLPLRKMADYYSIIGKDITDEINGIVEIETDPDKINMNYMNIMNVILTTNAGGTIYYNPSGNMFVILTGDIKNLTKLEMQGENYIISTVMDYYAVIGQKIINNQIYPYLPPEIIRTVFLFET